MREHAANSEALYSESQPLSVMFGVITGRGTVIPMRLGAGLVARDGLFQRSAGRDAGQVFENSGDRKSLSDAAAPDPIGGCRTVADEAARTGLP
jgi:hypothetical protein